MKPETLEALLKVPVWSARGSQERGCGSDLTKAVADESEEGGRAECGDVGEQQEGEEQARVDLQSRAMLVSLDEERSEVD